MEAWPICATRSTSTRPHPSSTTSSRTSPGWASGHPAAISHWEYFIVPDVDGPGCTVAEEWTDRRAAASRAISERILGDRRSLNKSGIRQTLAALKRSAEGQHHR